jgi:hypothetical protein
VPRPAYDKAKRKAEVKAEIGKKRRAKEAAAAFAPPSIAAAAPPRLLAPSIAPAAAPAMVRPLPYGLDGPAVPHKILFVQGIPPSATPSLLNTLFAQFPGWKEVRLVEARPGIAFVEYETEEAAAAALQGLQSFKMDDETLTLTFARR